MSGRAIRSRVECEGSPERMSEDSRDSWRKFGPSKRKQEQCPQAFGGRQEPREHAGERSHQPNAGRGRKQRREEPRRPQGSGCPNDCPDVLGSLPPPDTPCMFSPLKETGLKATCVAVYGEGGKGNQALRYPTGVAQLPDDSVVVCDTFNDRLVKYHGTGELQKVFNAEPPLLKPSAISLVTDCLGDGAAFAVKDHHDIVLFSADCQQIRSLTNRSLQRPYGLTIDEENGVLITVETGGRGTHITLVEPASGELRRVAFSLACCAAGASQSKPRFIAHLHTHVLVVVDLGMDAIAMVSTADGSVLRRFGGPGSGPGLFRDPSGVVCDADGLIVVGDSRNHRLQVFSPEGQFLTVLAVDKPLRRPSGLFLTQCSHLLVINYWGNSVAKYKIGE